MKSILGVAVAAVVSATLLAGCGSSQSGGSGKPVASSTPAQTASSASSAASPTSNAAALTPGDCALYTKDQAVALIGTVNMHQLPMMTLQGGKKIDTCAYASVKLGSPPEVNGFSYGVYEFPSEQAARTAISSGAAQLFVETKATKFTVVGVPVSAPIEAGYYTQKLQLGNDSFAGEATNVGPYAIWALGGTSGSLAHAEKLATTVLKALVGKAQGA